jgi:RimJ/RimL family protein N-acetyltransferase
MKAVFLKGDYINLRPLHLNDANERYLKWINDPEVTRGMATGYFPTSAEQLTDYVKGSLNDKNTIFLAMCDVNDEHVGNVKLDRIDWIAGTCELGIIIGEASARGKGYGREAMNLLIDFAFNELNLRKISLAVFENNPHAKHLYESLGFKQEGVFVKHVFKEGRLWDKYYYALFNPNQLP